MVTNEIRAIDHSFKTISAQVPTENAAAYYFRNFFSFGRTESIAPFTTPMKAEGIVGPMQWTAHHCE